MYSLRFDHGVVSAGFLLTPSGEAAAGDPASNPAAAWDRLVRRYPTIEAQYGAARPLFPIRFVPLVQHRFRFASGERWAMLPHSFAFVDPLFSTGIAWSLRAVERLVAAFEDRRKDTRRPSAAMLERYGQLLVTEADQIDRLVAGAYDSMISFDLFAAHSMIYFVTVSFGEIKQRLVDGNWGWDGFLGVTDPVLAPVPAMAARRLRRLTRGGRERGSDRERAGYVKWVERTMAPRNVAGLADPSRRNLYPVDLDVLIDRHALLDLDREAIIAALPRLRGMTG
jgi:FADH2 O2-dependent halogenase